MEAQKGLGKLALVDNAWLSAATKGMGIERISAKGLYGVLKYQVGPTRVFYKHPVITLHPALAVPGHRITEKFKQVGFTVRHGDSTNEEDDLILVKELEDADPRAMSDVAILSGDHRFIVPAVRKAQQMDAAHGKRDNCPRVWWLTTEYCGKNGNSCVGRRLQSYFEQAKFGVIELADFKRQLEFQPP